MLSHESHGVDRLLQVRLLFNLARATVAEPGVESGVVSSGEGDRTGLVGILPVGVAIIIDGHLSL